MVIPLYYCINNNWLTKLIQNTNSNFHQLSRRRQTAAQSKIAVARFLPRPADGDRRSLLFCVNEQGWSRSFAIQLLSGASVSISSVVWSSRLNGRRFHHSLFYEWLEIPAWVVRRQSVFHLFNNIIYQSHLNQPTVCVAMVSTHLSKA